MSLLFYVSEINIKLILATDEPEQTKNKVQA